jgi:hypothetical protein
VTGIMPSSIDLAVPPPTFTVSGSGFTNLGFGLPVVNFMRNGAALGQARATAMTATSLTVPYPNATTKLPSTGNLPGLSAGPIVVDVWLQTGTSSFSLLGSTALTVTDTRPPAGVTGIIPNVISLAVPPASFTLTGGRFENLGFGLPVVNFMRNGAALGQARATAITAASLTVPYPNATTKLPSTGNLPGLSAGPIVVDVWLQTGTSSFSLLGSTALTAQ